MFFGKYHIVLAHLHLCFSKKPYSIGSFTLMFFEKTIEYWLIDTDVFRKYHRVNIKQAISNT